MVVGIINLLTSIITATIVFAFLIYVPGLLLSTSDDHDSVESIRRVPAYRWFAVALPVIIIKVGMMSLCAWGLPPSHSLLQVTLGQLLGAPVFVPLAWHAARRWKLSPMSIFITIPTSVVMLGPTLAWGIMSALGLPAVPPMSSLSS